MIGLIWAQAANRVIGADGDLPWHLPEDLAHFKRMTAGATVVMGRRTWQSLPSVFRPLPGRRNIVLSRNSEAQFAGAQARTDLGAVLAEQQDAATETWVIGGASLYAAALEFADQVVVTELAEDFAGDTHAPELGPQWRDRHDREPVDWTTSKSGLEYRIRYLVRDKPDAPMAIDLTDRSVSSV